MGKLLLFEVNEVPFKVIDRYVAKRPSSILADLLNKSRAYVTHTEDAIQLDPWISWPTLHRGVTDETHGILHLGQPTDEQDKEMPPIWRLLQTQGVRTGVFGSLNSSALPDNVLDYAFYLPDYFSDQSFAHPASLNAFSAFNLAMTRQSARNVSTGIPVRESLNFMAGSAGLGVRPRTAGLIAKQLVQERLNPQRKIRRRNLQPALMLDLFMKQMRTSKPDFATFYTNNVAAAMHRYWAALFPEDYETLDLSPDWIEAYSEEIIAAMDMLDLMLGQLKDFVDRNPDYSLMVATSLGQAAIPAKQTYSFLTITDLSRFMSKLGIPSDAWELRPAMVPCLSVLLKSDHIETVTQTLDTLKIDGNAMQRSSKIVSPMSYDIRDGNHLHLFIQMDSYDGPTEAVIGNEAYSFEELGLSHFAHEDGVNCTAQHIPEGSLIVYNPNSGGDGAHRTQISTIDVAPSLLSYFGLPKPAYMKGRASVSFA